MTASLEEWAADKVQVPCVICRLDVDVVGQVDASKLPRPLIRKWLAEVHGTEVSRDQMARHAREHA